MLTPRLRETFVTTVTNLLPEVLAFVSTAPRGTGEPTVTTLIKPLQKVQACISTATRCRNPDWEGLLWKLWQIVSQKSKHVCPQPIGAHTQTGRDCHDNCGKSSLRNQAFVSTATRCRNPDWERLLWQLWQILLQKSKHVCPQPIGAHTQTGRDYNDNCGKSSLRNQACVSTATTINLSVKTTKHRFKGP